MRGGALTMPEVKYEAVQFGGGLDLVTPTLRLKPGVLRDSLNFEVAATGGYARIGGYERFDGRAKPSSATYTILQVEAFTAQPALGDTLTGQTTGTTGSVIAVGSNYIIVTLVVGPGYSSTEVVKVGATLIATLIPLDTVFTALQSARFLSLAANVYRALIGAVPGSGPIRGVFAMNIAGTHTVFAFRDNVGATATNLYKSTNTGWTQVAYLYEVSFNTGSTAAPATGATLTQGGVTATIKRLCQQSNATFASNTAVGRLIVTAPAGGNFAAGAATYPGGSVNLLGIQTAITFSTGGKFQFDLGNFSGQGSSQRIYGCDNVNRCFEFDGETLAPISWPVGAPTNIAVHKQQLIVSFQSSIFNSAPGNPFDGTALSGASEIPVGDQVTAIIVLPGDQSSPAALIACASSYRILYGSTAVAGSADLFRVGPFNVRSGVASYSVQSLDQAYFFDKTGVSSLRRSQAFGNFDPSTMTFNIAPYLIDKRPLLTSSCVNKARSQYRLFFSDGTALFMTIVNGKYLGAGPIKYAHSMQCVWNGELASGNEVTYAGDSNGFVYQLDIGSSCDGQAMDFWMTPNWINMSTPRTRKRMRSATLEIQGTSYAAINFSHSMGYGASDFAVQPARQYESNFSGIPTWDSGILWDVFTWDGSTSGPVEIELSGTAENIQPKFQGSSDLMFAFTLSSLIIGYTPRRRMR